MKKFSTPVSDGGRPYFNDQFTDVLQGEIYKVMEGIASMVDDETEGLVISGCKINSYNPGTGAIDITAGVVYIAGQYRDVPAFIGNLLVNTLFIVEDVDVVVQKTFKDGLINDYTTTATAKYVQQASQPVTQFIEVLGATILKWGGNDLGKGLLNRTRAREFDVFSAFDVRDSEAPGITTSNPAYQGVAVLTTPNDGITRTYFTTGRATARTQTATTGEYDLLIRYGVADVGVAKLENLGVIASKGNVIATAVGQVPPNTVIEMFHRTTNGAEYLAEGLKLSIIGVPIL